MGQAPLTDLFKSESWEYFRRNYAGRDLRALPLHPYVAALLAASPIDITGGSVLEIGCSAGNNLHHLRRDLQLARAVGTEPSDAVVEELGRAHPDLEFVVSDSKVLPFATGEFDLVLIRSVLHWVDRDFVLQALGEAIRVARTYLIVSDFSPSRPYSSEYHHQPGYRTFKQSYAPVLEATGLVRRVAMLTHAEDDEWNRCETGLYRKLTIDEAFPLRTEDDVRR